MHPCLSQLFLYVMKNSTEDVDVLARAGYYYNMLKDRLSDLKAIFDDIKSSLTYKENLDETDVSKI